MKLKYIGYNEEVERFGFFNNLKPKIIKVELPNLTVGKIYSVIHVPAAYCCRGKLIVFADNDKWVHVYFDDYDLVDLIACFIPVE